MRKIHLLLPAAALILLSGCNPYTLIEADKPASVGTLSVMPQIAWADARSPGLDGTMWTADGPNLDALMFFPGIKPGKPLVKGYGVDRDKLQVFKADMVPDDVMELLASNLATLDYQQIQTANLRPAAFGAADGFRFEITCTTKSGLLMKGAAIAAIRDGKLDLILFLAADEYYYGRYSEAVERLFASIKTG